MKSITVTVDDKTYKTWTQIKQLQSYSSELTGLSDSELDTALFCKALELLEEQTIEWMEMVEAWSKDKEAVEKWRAEQQQALN